MENKEKNLARKSKGTSFSIAMYVVASVVALVGVALLANNIILYKSTVSQAVTQGYDIATVRKAVLTSQLLPGIFEPIGIYGGIAFLLLGVGKVNKKVSNYLMLLTKVEVDHDILEEIAVDVENIETNQQIETQQDIEKA